MGTPIPLALVALFLGVALVWRAWVQRGPFAFCRNPIFLGMMLCLRTYGDAYRAYAARTGRFLPGLGRL